MSARILVVDDVPANVRLLQDKLEREYYEVFTANGGREALEKVRRVKPDIVLLDVMMPDVNGIEVCHRMKADPALAHIPVIMITALDAPEDRLRGLKAGADDFLSKPINDTDLFVRIRSLLRRKLLVDELLAGGEGASDTLERFMPLIDEQQPARVSLIDDGDLLRPRIEQALRGRHEVTVIEPQAVAALEAGGCCDLIVLNLDLHSASGLRICALLRSHEQTRHIPVIAVLGHYDADTIEKAMELGAGDYLVLPLDPEEFAIRAEAQIRHGRLIRKLREQTRHSITMSVTDPLTGLYNRRHMTAQGEALVSEALNRGRSLGLLLLDLDHFKAINDRHGHDAGDRVLKEFADRLKGALRKVDIICRIGGEEFVVLLPDAGEERVGKIAERLRHVISARPFSAGTPDAPLMLPVTVSIGVAVCDRPDDTLQSLLKRADEALYAAKNAGRNRVEYAA